MSRAVMLLKIQWLMVCACVVCLGLLALHSGLHLYATASNQLSVLASIITPDPGLQFDLLLNLSKWLTQLRN